MQALDSRKITLPALKAWFGTVDETYFAKSSDETELAITKLTSLLAMELPLCQELALINALLIEKQASYLGCLTAWSYYYEIQQAHSSAPGNQAA